MYNIIEYSNIYSKISGGFWQYHREEPVLDIMVVFLILLLIIIVFHSNLKIKITTGKTGKRWHKRYWNNHTVEISKLFSRTLEMPLSNCEINLILTSSANCF